MAEANPRTARLVGLLVLVAVVVITLVVLLDRGDDSDGAGTSGAAPPATTPADSGTAPAEDEPDDATDVTPTQAARAGFTLAASGDVLVHESVAEVASPSGDAQGTAFDFRPMFDMVRPALSSADLAICHLETPLSSTNTGLSYYPVFNVPGDVADAIADAGYDSCSAASNHALDSGEAGIVDTLTEMDRVGVEAPGIARTAAEAERTVLLDANGYTVGHLSYTYGINSGTVPEAAPWLTNIIDADTILADAAAHRAAGAEFVVVSLQWGNQYQNEPTTEQRALAQQLLASPDIDLILGSHVHVVQPIERIGDKYVIYGLGNFVSNQSPETCPSECPPGVEDGMIVTVTVEEDAAGKLQATGLAYTPTWVDRSDYTIVPVEEGLTRSDDPDMTSRLQASRQRTDAAVTLLGGP